MYPSEDHDRKQGIFLVRGYGPAYALQFKSLSHRLYTGRTKQSEAQPLLRDARTWYSIPSPSSYSPPLFHWATVDKINDVLRHCNQ